MDAASVIIDVRRRAGLSLRALARLADTSHSAIAAYEQGRVSPSADTLNRIVESAGFAIDFTVERRQGGEDRSERGRELVEVLELATMFPTHHEPLLAYPPFADCCPSQTASR